MPMKERDTQRARLYAADDVLEPLAVTFDSIEDIERYVRRIWKSKRLRASYPDAFRHWTRDPTVRRGIANTYARGGVHGIKLPTWAWRQNVVIHELAHTITHRHFGWDVAGHGWQFCSVYLRMTLLFMGRYAHDNLKLSFKHHRVRFRAPRKSAPVSPERRAELVARLARLRSPPLLGVDLETSEHHRGAGSAPQP